MRPARSISRALHRELARCVALVLGLALVLSLMRGGSRYLYCPYMDAVVTDGCCSVHDRTSTIRERDCCEVRSVSALPAIGAVGPRPELAPAPLVLVLGPVADRSPEALRPSPPVVARSGLSPPLTNRAAQRLVLRI
jgi:hypothetical protein